MDMSRQRAKGTCKENVRYTGTREETGSTIEARWKDLCNRDIESVGLNVEDVMNGTKWKRQIQTIAETPDDGK